jgi:hypothetical protein
MVNWKESGSERDVPLEGVGSLLSFSLSYHTKKQTDL